MQTTHLRLTGMDCGGCASTVAAALKEMGGVHDVKVTFSTRDARILYDERITSPEKLTLAVTGAGYGVEAAAAPDQAAPV